MRRSRASSDPGTSLPVREDLELQPMSSKAEASVRLSVDEWAALEGVKIQTSNNLAAPNAPQIDATTSTESLQTTTAPDPGAVRSVTTSTIRESETQVRVTIDTSTSARSSAEEASPPGPEETAARATQGRQPTGLSPQSDDHVLGQGTESPELGPFARFCAFAEMPPTRPLKNTERNLEDFFEQYRSIVKPRMFDKFCATLGRKRNFRASLMDGTRHRRGYQSSWKPSEAKDLREYASIEGLNILLIEDVDIDCIMALDSEFGLDSRFILHYMSRIHFSSNPLEELQTEGVPNGGHGAHEAHFHRADPSIAASWYVTACKMEGELALRSCDPSRTAWQSVSKFLDRGEAIDQEVPWWAEDIRQFVGSVDGPLKILSKMACYCLSEDIRLLLVESTPRMSAQTARPFDHWMRFGSFRRTFQRILPVSLQLLTTRGRFAVFDCFQSLISGSRHPDRDFEVERLACKKILLLGDEWSSDHVHVLNKVTLSTWALVSYQWQSNLDWLRSTSTRQRFDALAQPGMRTYLPLVHLRQLIVGMRDSLPLAEEESRSLDEYTGTRLRHLSLQPSNLSKVLAEVAIDLDKLDKELNDEIHLIIGAVTVQDSDANKVQTERATLLTALAAIYLPLTLVTGIFGMNIKDINDTNPSWRACGIVLAVVAAGTIGFVVAYWQWGVWRRGRQEKERMGLGFRKDV